jgi:hypothetical protein
MLKKDVDIKWTQKAKSSFERIKQALIEALVLISPDYSKDFLIFSFASEETIDVALLQKNEEEYEQPIYFFRKSIRDV